MQTYESEIKVISKPQELVFNMLSDLSNLEKVKTLNIEGREKAEEFFKEVEFDSDTLHFTVPAVGRVGFRVIERDPFKTIKLEAISSPVAANGWIQLVKIDDETCKMKLTIKAELPMMIKMMVDSKMKKGVDKIADAIVMAVSAGEQ
ncbi:MAG: SRPBCC family protein [Porphyromonadaceae bacterium]|nr:SRPBCC family protein [Porphyromonadaceae bacterium]